MPSRRSRAKTSRATPPNSPSTPASRRLPNRLSRALRAPLWSWTRALARCSHVPARPPTTTPTSTPCCNRVAVRTVLCTTAPWTPSILRAPRLRSSRFRRRSSPVQRRSTPPIALRPRWRSAALPSPMPTTSATAPSRSAARLPCRPTSPTASWPATSAPRRSSTRRTPLGLASRSAKTSPPRPPSCPTRR